MRYLVSALVVVLAAPAWAQSPRAATAGERTAAALGRGWSAIAQGQAAKAVEVARQLLGRDPGSHDAAALAIAAFAADRRGPDALNAYERWLQVSAHEDVFILRTVATAILRAWASGPQPRVKMAALAALAQSGDAEARAELSALAVSANAPIEADAALAALGDPDAVSRLEAQITGGGPRDKSWAIDALRAAGSRTSAAAIAVALKDPAPPSRMAAANALADLGATDAVPALKSALQDPDPSVQHMVAVALARLGDTTSGVTLQSLEQSPIGELRLLAAQAAAEQSPGGDWTALAQPLLRDADPIVRLRAATLLLKHGREADAAQAVLAAGLADPSPALRTSAATLFIEHTRGLAGEDDVPTLRRLLRDSLPDVQVAAAAGILAPPPARRQ